MPAAISAQQPLAVEAGAKVLMSGGNAFDAAVTAALVQAIVSPQMCGIGGYAVINLHLAGEPGSIGVDAPALAGALVQDDMWVDKLIRPNPAAGATSSKAMSMKPDTHPSVRRDPSKCSPCCSTAGAPSTSASRRTGHPHRP